MTTRLHRCSLIALFIVVAFLKLEGVFVDYWQQHHTCFVDRFNPATPKLHGGWATVWLYASYVLIALICILAGFKQRVNFSKACYMTVVNLTGYCFITFLKELIADTICNQTKANSVSGHFAFYLYHILTLPHLWRYSFWPEDNEPWTGRKEVVPDHKPVLRNVIKAAYIAFVALTCFTLYRTYFFGYHSLSQCLNGILFGILMYLCTLPFMRYLDDPTQEELWEARLPRPTNIPPCFNLPLILLGLSTILALFLADQYHGSVPLAHWELLVFMISWIKVLWGAP